MEQWTSAFCRELVGNLSRFKEWSVIAPGANPACSTRSRRLLAELCPCPWNMRWWLAPEVPALAPSTCGCGLATRSMLVSDQIRPPRQLAVGVQRHLQPCRLRIQISIATTRLRSVADRSSQQRQAYDLWLEGERLSWL